MPPSRDHHPDTRPNPSFPRTLLTVISKHCSKQRQRGRRGTGMPKETPPSQSAPVHRRWCTVALCLALIAVAVHAWRSLRAATRTPGALETVHDGHAHRGTAGLALDTSFVGGLPADAVPLDIRFNNVVPNTTLTGNPATLVWCKSFLIHSATRVSPPAPRTQCGATAMSACTPPTSSRWSPCQAPPASTTCISTFALPTLGRGSSTNGCSPMWRTRMKAPSQARTRLNACRPRGLRAVAATVPRDRVDLQLPPWAERGAVSRRCGYARGEWRAGLAACHPGGALRRGTRSSRLARPQRSAAVGGEGQPRCEAPRRGPVRGGSLRELAS